MRLAGETANVFPEFGIISVGCPIRLLRYSANLPRSSPHGNIGVLLTPKLASSGRLGFRIERLNDEHSAKHIVLVGQGLVIGDL